MSYRFIHKIPISILNLWSNNELYTNTRFLYGNGNKIDDTLEIKHIL